MKGLAILHDFPDSQAIGEPRPEGGSFAQLFAPILEVVAKLYWITLHCESSPFQNAMAGIEAFEQVSALAIDVDARPSGLDIQLWRPPTLADLAAYVRDDWQDFLGVRRDRDPLEVTRKFAELDERASMLNPGWTPAIENEREVEFLAAIEEGVEIAFFSNDAGVWEVYAADSHLLDAVLNQCRGLDEGVIRVKPANLGNREQVLSEIYTGSTRG